MLAKDGSEWSTQHQVVKKIAAAIKDMQYGSVTVIIQDATIVQIERTEKIRVR